MVAAAQRRVDAFVPVGLVAVDVLGALVQLTSHTHLILVIDEGRVSEEALEETRLSVLVELHFLELLADFPHLWRPDGGVDTDRICVLPGFDWRGVGHELVEVLSVWSGDRLTEVCLFACQLVGRLVLILRVFVRFCQDHLSTCR